MPDFFLCEHVYIKTKAEEKQLVKRNRRKKKETQIDSGMLSFLYEGDHGELQRFIDFSELLCSHCYPRVLSTVHWTHAAPQAVISV